MTITIGDLGFSKHLPLPLLRAAEFVSGLRLENVCVHYNSDNPQKLGFAAYTRGYEIFLASGQQAHLPHELWHVVQQLSGQVKAREANNSRSIVLNKQLEQEADVMGAYLAYIADHLSNL